MTRADPLAQRAPRVALVMIAVGDLSGSGGTERQFSGLHEYLAGRSPGASTFVTTRIGLARLRAAGRLADASGVQLLSLGDHPATSRLGVAWMTARLLVATIGRGFDVVHLCQPTPIYVPYAAIVSRLPRAWRPSLTMTVTDCTLAHNLTSAQPPSDEYEMQVLDAHRLYFAWSKLDGVYSWYQALVAAARRLRLVPETTHLAAARYCFADVERFRPAPHKDNVVLYAGRLSAQKRPLLFVDAVHSLLRRYSDLAAGWRFALYGAGRLEDAVRERLAALGLGDAVTLGHTADMSPVFARSRLFVSTQDLENFTSLAMLEAMAAGNAVIALDVGQTGEFVRHGENGLVVKGDTPDAVADAMAEYLRNPRQHDAMGAASQALATQVHTVDHFAADITTFWREVIHGH